MAFKVGYFIGSVQGALMRLGSKRAKKLEAEK
jgi:hypothetical protein